MFVGHYAPALAARAHPKAPGLAAGFIAVQLIDVGFMTLSWIGIEKWAPNPALEGLNPIDLYFMPYTHSLLATGAWAAAAALLFAMIAPAGKRLAGSAIIFALVVSHWLLDLPVHRHDLGILGDEASKLGFGLWNWPLIAMPLEMGVLAAGMAIYVGNTKPRNWLGHVMPWIFLVALVATQAVNWFGPPPANAAAFSGTGLLAYGVVALLGLALDATRSGVHDGP